jgi:hypothetical protein
MKAITSLVFAALVVLTPVSAGAFDLKSADVAGLRVGMTRAEAEAALKKHAPDLTIQPYEITYSYSDGAAHHQTPPILSRLAAKRQVPGGTGEREEFILVFFGLPGKEVVTALKRSHAGYPNPTSRAGFLQAVTAKYGAPVVAFQGNQWVKWTTGSGKRDCFAIESTTEISDPLMELARAYYNIQDIAECESGLVYSAGRDPVTEFMVTLVDPALVEATDRQVHEWIEALEAEAVRQREANAEAPRL